MRIGWAAPLTMALALLTRLPGLSRPGVLVFDEQYWVTGAVDLIQWGSTHGQFKHPPLGQWMIASGISTFGLTPFGWRVAALLAGVATVGVVSATVRKLTGDQVLAACAGTLCALDGVMFTTGRMGMLDVFVGLFVSLTVWGLSVLWKLPTTNRPVIRRVGVATLVAGGLAGSVKWLAVLVVLVVLASLLVRDRQSVPAGSRRRRAMALSVVLAVVIPMGVYLITWAPQQLGPDAWTPSAFVQTHRDVARFHLELAPQNSNAAPASSWFLMTRPTRLFAQDCANPAARRGAGPCHGASAGSGAMIVVQPNPMVWLVCMAALLGLLISVVRRRSTIAMVLLGVVATQWGDWLINRRWAYTFYLTAIIPTLIVAAAWLVGPKRARRLRMPLIAVMVCAVALFVFFYPVWTGRALPNSALAQRIWWWGWTD